MIDDIVDHVALLPKPEYPDRPNWRRRRLRKNRRYRLAIRSRLPREKRERKRVRFDETEDRLLEGRFELDLGNRGGFVRSPMSIEQVSKSTVPNLVHALGNARDSVRFDGHDAPIGGADELMTVISRYAEREPGRAVELARHLVAKGEKQRGRYLIREIATHHQNLEVVEELVGDLLEANDSPLETDDECAAAIGIIVGRGHATVDSIAWIRHRLSTSTSELHDAA